jgi:dTDP-4-dehydrorhamnose reductase
VLHFSTDYVFDGSGGTPWRETDRPNPINAYGEGKRDGELLLQEAMAGGRYWIVRTSWVFGLQGGNFLKTILRLAREREQLSVVDDQIGAPTPAALIADIGAQLLRVQPASGIYHLATAGETSWYGYARHAIARARASGLPMRLANAALTPIGSDGYPTPAARPRNSRLDCTKIEQALSVRLPDWRQTVDRTVDELLENGSV